MVFLTMSFASALTTTNLTLVSPASSSSIGGTDVVLNLSVDSVIPIENFNLVTFYAKSASTANSSWVTLASVANTSDTMFNTTFNTLILEDAIDYIFNATISNSSNNVSITNTAIKVDNTAPATPTGIISGEQNTLTPSFTATIIGANVTGCSINFTGRNPGSLGYSMTHSGDLCTISSINMPEQTYLYTITAHDGTNSSTTAETTIQISTAPSSGGSKGTGTTTTTQSSSPFGTDSNLTTIIVILAIIGLGFVLIKRINK